jgi:hypothetical protein
MAVGTLDVTNFLQVLGDAAVKLVSSGPLGLVALMAVVATIIMMFVPFTPAIERFSRLVMSLIALCLFGILIIQYFSGGQKTAHMVRFRVDPTSLATYRDYPPPQIEINNVLLGKPYEFKVERDVSAVIDVSEAFEKARKSQQEAMLQINKITQLQSGVVSSARALQDIAETASTITCPAPGSTITTAGKVFSFPDIAAVTRPPIATTGDDFLLKGKELAAQPLSSQIIAVQAESALQKLEQVGLAEPQSLRSGGFQNMATVPN